MLRKYPIFSVLIVFALLLLTGCGKQEEIVSEKTPFFVDAVAYNDLSSTVFVEKSASLLEQQQITISAQVAGRVQSIPGREWDDVLSGEPIIQLTDTIASYGLQAQRAKNNLDRALAQEQQTRLSLEDAVVSAEAGVVQAAEALRVAQSNRELNVKWQTLAVDQSRIATENQLRTIQISYESEYASLRNLLVDVLDFWDSILWVTIKYRTANDDFEILLWAKDTQIKQKSESALYALYALEDVINAIDTDDVSTALTSLETFVDTYDQIQWFLAIMQQLFINSVTAVNLPQAQLDGFAATAAALQTRTQTARAAFGGFRTQAINALSPLSGVSGSLAYTVGQESAEISLETLRQSLDNAVINAQLWLQNAERAYTQAQNARDKQQRVLETQIQDAQLAYQDAMRQASKLSVGAPVRGVLWSILVAPGQDVQVGMPLFTIVGTDNQLLSMNISSQELPYLIVGQDVDVLYGNDMYSWQIQSVPRVADGSMQYRVLISLSSPLATIGSVAKVSVPFVLDNPVLPLNAISGIQWDKWIINVLDDENVISQISVSLWRTWGTVVELLSPIDQKYRIILNDVGSYDANDFSLEVSQ